ncbi:Glutaredoxin-2 [Smittium mucronatum]|uniref:Glutaredoxin-2 n=1 Tax=Smittium mucronatum TaxID=133383 RepID=A0A1R0H4X8_9FUNG|nr:Glutaredoxin-2 [Smittium mucronatum]
MFRLRRSTKALINRVGLVILLVLAFLQFRSFFSKKTEETPEETFSRLVLQEYKNSIGSNDINVFHFLIISYVAPSFGFFFSQLLGVQDSFEFKNFEKLLEASSKSTDITWNKSDYATFYENILKPLETDDSMKAILFVKNIPITYKQIKPLTSQQFLSKLTSLLPSVQKRFEVEADKFMQKADSSNSILIIHSQNSKEMDEAKELVVSLGKKYNILHNFHQINSDLPFANSKVYGKYSIPSIFFQKRFYSFPEFSDASKNGSLEPILSKIKRDLESKLELEFSKILTENKVILLLSSTASGSIHSYKVFENYKNHFGLSYKPVWVDDSNSKLIKSKLGKSDGDFPCIFINGDFFLDYDSFADQFAQGTLFESFEAKSLFNSEAVEQQVNRVKKELSELLKSNKYLITSTSDNHLAGYIKASISKADPSAAMSIYNADESAYDITIAKRALKPIDLEFPALFESGELVVMGETKIRSLLSSERLISLLKDVPIPKQHSKETLIDLIKSYKMIMFSKTYCPYCRGAKQLLDKHNLDYHVLEVNLEPNQMDIKHYLTEISGGHSSFPSIFIMQQSKGGLSDLMQLESSGELKSLVEKYDLVKK